MKESVFKAIVIIAFIVLAVGAMFLGLPWAVQTAFSVFGISVSYVQSIALLTLTTLFLGALKD